MTARAPLIAARLHPEGYLAARPRRGSGRHGAVLAHFFESDVQADAASVRVLLAETAAAERGEPPQPASIGNAFAVRICAAGTELRNVVRGDAPEFYALDEWRAALETWRAAIERPRR